MLTSKSVRPPECDRLSIKRSSAVTFSTFAILIKRLRLGHFLPVSIFTMCLHEVSINSASFSCVRFLSARKYLILNPIKSHFISINLTETFREKPKKGEEVEETIDTRKGYYPDDIAGTFGVPLEEHKRQTQVTVEKGYINVAMLTGDKKTVEIDETGKQLKLDDSMPVYSESAELEHSDETGEVPDEIRNMEL